MMPDKCPSCGAGSSSKLKAAFYFRGVELLYDEDMTHSQNLYAWRCGACNHLFDVKGLTTEVMMQHD
jgi:hypothetical protein